MGGKNVKITMVERLLGALSPHLCCGCGKIGAILCEYCKNDIINDPLLNCIACFYPHSRGICASHATPYDQVWSVSSRRHVMKRLVDIYKFERTKSAATTLIDMLDASIPLLPPDTVIIPVPTRRSHVRQRGYDHTLVLAREFANRRGLVVESLLEHVSSHTQHFLGRTERLAQSKGSFRVIGRVRPDAQYLILDDIITTGSTISEVAEVLVSAGAKKPWVAALAHQPLDQTQSIC